MIFWLFFKRGILLDIYFVNPGVSKQGKLLCCLCSSVTWNESLLFSSIVPDPYTPRTSLVAQMAKNQPAMRETLGGEDPLEKGMATHSGILTWVIPRPEEPDGLQFMGLQRVRHDGMTNTLFFIYIEGTNSIRSSTKMG